MTRGWRLPLPVLALACAAFASVAAEEPRVLTALYPEGPLWSGEALYYAEMRADRIMLSDAQGERVFFVRRGCGPTAIAPYGEGFLILCHLGAYVVAVDAEGQETRRWDRDRSGARLLSPNDASADGAGGVYFTDSGRFARDARPHGRIMHLSADGALKRVAGPLWYPNGAAVKDGELYVSEHLRRRILLYAIEADGHLGRASAFADVPKTLHPSRYRSAYALAGPDGLEFGPDGALHVAVYGEGRVIRFSPRGEFLSASDVPTRFVTNVAFGRRGVALTGAFDNRTPPFSGEVRILDGLP